MERKILKSLLEWKNSSNRKPLILHGARQVGKTYAAITFGKRYYKNTIYINMEDSEKIQKIFEGDLDTKRILRELSVITGQSILKEDTLIIFDEIQACERALTSLKYFCENAPEYHIIAAGSLLGISINRDRYSFPVGKVDMKTLYPLDFEEFLNALFKEDLVSMIREHFNDNSEFSCHEAAMDLYKTYLVLGGMPRAVLTYIDKEDFNFVLAEQKNINDSYIADMAKYATSNETIKIIASFNSVPAQLAKENKKFQYKLIKTGARAYEYEYPVEWLVSSGVVNKCVKVTEGKLPLCAYAKYDFFKIYMADTGLLCSKFSIPAKFILSSNDGLNNFKGALAENYVCSALAVNGYTPYYWESSGSAELDFVIQDTEGNIIPIEVKSGENVNSKSLQVFVKKYNPKYSIRISAKNFGFENNIKSIPLYATFCV